MENEFDDKTRGVDAPDAQQPQQDGLAQDAQEQASNEAVQEDAPAQDAQNTNNSTPKGGSGRRRKVISGLLLLLSIALFVGGVFMILQEHVIDPITTYRPPSLTATPYSPPPTPFASAELTPGEPTPSPTPYALLPMMISFPTLEQTCEIQPVGRTESGAMDTIDSNIIAAWYRHGPSPGDYGNALINGHKSWNKVKGVFAQLIDLDSGDPVVIFMDDASELTFYVHSVDVYDREAVPASVMNLDRGSEPRITLITCIGDWDYGARTSRERVAVVCKLYPPEVASTEEVPASAAQ